MKITKFGHACLLVEENGKRLLFDPGVFSFNEEFTPEKVGPVDVIIITHSHQDHLVPETLKAFLKMSGSTIISGQEIHDILQKEHINSEVLALNQEHDVAGFSIKAMPAEHEPMPIGQAENIAYLINGRLLHPGDSYDTRNIDFNPEILALPTQAPWSRLVDAVAFAKTLKPKHALSIHNALLKDEIGQMFDGFIGQALSSEDITLHSLAMGESIEL